MALNLMGPLSFGIIFLATRSVWLSTFALLGGALAALTAIWLRERRVAPFPLALALLTILFGTLTIATESLGFLKLELIVRRTTIGLTLLIMLAAGSDPFEMLFGRALHLVDGAWRKLALRFALFDLVVAAAGLIIWRTQDDTTWVLFKFPGQPILNLGFLAAQLPLIARARRPAGSKTARRREHESGGAGTPSAMTGRR